jgi:thiol-disulfide isomerase/thioredoxin
MIPSNDPFQSQQQRGMRERWTVVILLAAIAVVYSVAGALFDGSLKKGTTAPGFDSVGSTIEATLVAERFKGKVVLLDFWATYCVTCQYLAPALTRLEEAYGPAGLAVIAVSLDPPQDTARARLTFTEWGGTVEILFDSARALQEAYRITALPQTFLISRQGRILWQQAGIRQGDEALFLETSKGRRVLEEALSSR